MRKYSGLSNQEVEERKRAGQVNRPVESPAKSDLEIIRDNTFTYFNLIFVVLAVILLMVGSPRDLTFLPVVIANTVIGIVQEIRSKRALEKLKVMSAPKAKVIREGRKETILVEEIVLGDIIRFKAGDQIPVDAKVIDGELSVNEALLTGEADEIMKREGAELMSGSFVVSGEGIAEATRVGAEAYVAQLTLQAKAMKGGEQSEILRSLNRIVTILGIIIVPVGIVMVSEQLLKGAGIQDSVRSMVAAVVGMIPEGLFLLASATLAISVVRLARKEVLVHEMRCIETLARVDVLCVDKTGTITEDKMEVVEVLENVEGGSAILGRFVGAQRADNATMKALKAYKYFDPQSPSSPGVASRLRNATQETGDQNAQSVSVLHSAKSLRVYGFSSKYKYSAVDFEEGAFVLGAPELILRGGFEQYRERVEKYSRKGYRVLVLGRYEGKLGEELTGAVEVVAMVVLKNRIRKTAAETFRYFAEQGVEVKVISGDSPLTVSEVAREAGILGAEKYVDLTGVSGKELVQAAKKYTVFGRVTPEQKRRLVKALQEAGHTVAMTGDGVNDVLALKDADCSVAMASGAQAATQVAQLVLLDSDFSRMPEVVREGRRVVNNLERSGSLFLVKNIFSLTMAVLAIILAVRYPLVPNQLTLVTMWTIGVPSFFLAQMPNHRLIKGKFIDNIMGRAFWGAMADVVVVGVIMIVGKWMGLSSLQVGTMCAMGMAAVGFVYMYIIARPMDFWKRVVVFGCLAGFGLSVILVPGLWNLVAWW